MTWRQRSVGRSTVGTRAPSPALLTRMSIRPWRPAIAPTTAATCGLVGDVQPMRLALPDLARHRFGGSEIDVGHRDMGAGLGQRLRGRAADAVAAAGHQRDPPVQAQQPEIVRHPALPAQARYADRFVALAAANWRSSVISSKLIRRASQR